MSLTVSKRLNKLGNAWGALQGGWGHPPQALALARVRHWAGRLSRRTPLEKSRNPQ